jgi:hypothetical protein
MPLPFQPRSLDADAAAFIQRSGATDRAAINAFVRGVKALGLWNNMVCWPLRSTQNAGTGTTAYSLGGLGTFNGTLVGGPTWAVDGSGVTFDGSKLMTTSGLVHNPSTTNSSLVAVVSSSEVANNLVIVEMANLSAPLSGVRLRRDDSRYGISVFASNQTQVVTSISGSATANVFAFAAGSFSPSQQFAVANASQSSVATTTLANANTISFQLGLAVANFNGTNAFAAYFGSTALTFAQTQSLRTLYKSTLGTGLGLP